MTAYGFYQGEAEFTAGVQIGCLLLAFLCASFSYAVWCATVGGYDLLTAAAVRLSRIIERRAEASDAVNVTQTAAGANPAGVDVCVTESEHEQQGETQ
jgi:hypothetical protein